MTELILAKIKVLEGKIAELNEIYGEDWEEFDPSDGGNFDDTYYLGFEHGEIYGQLELLEELLNTHNG